MGGLADGQQRLSRPIAQKTFEGRTDLPFWIMLNRHCIETKIQLISTRRDERGVPILGVTTLRLKINEGIIALQDGGDSRSGCSEINSQSHSNRIPKKVLVFTHRWPLEK